jgi:hypothetical protein
LRGWGGYTPTTKRGCFYRPKVKYLSPCPSPHFLGLDVVPIPPMQLNRPLVAKAYQILSKAKRGMAQHQIAPPTSPSATEVLSRHPPARMSGLNSQGADFHLRCPLICTTAQHHSFRGWQRCISRGRNKRLAGLDCLAARGGRVLMQENVAHRRAPTSLTS